MIREKTPKISEILQKAAQKARKEVAASTQNEPPQSAKETWPVDTTIGPGLEGAIACYTKIGHVNGAQGVLTYRGYNVFDLAINSTFEETTYLLLFGKMPTERQLEAFKKKLIKARFIPRTLRLLMSVPVEDYNPMGGLRLGINFMRRIHSHIEDDDNRPDPMEAVSADEDSIPEETEPMGHKHAVYEYEMETYTNETIKDVCYLISGMSTMTAAISRLRQNKLPIDPREDLSHAGNLLYMMTGKEPTPEEERIMDISLILHADHGMNASTFASMVVASTLSDIYFSIGAGVAALNGPLHGGANEQVLYMLENVHKSGDVQAWYAKAREKKQKIMGFGHRVYKTYDPRARILGPLADYMGTFDKDMKPLLGVAKKLEKEVVKSLGKDKGIFPNVDFYSGLVYRAMEIQTPMFTPLFAVSRVSGWTARCLEYLKNNRIFRPRAIYTGKFDTEYQSIENRGRKKN